jgi:TRAP-type mannitol/chloroaromatic compound transport system substrate-binding protein
MKRREWLQGAGAAAAVAGLAACGKGVDTPPVAADAARHWKMATAWPIDFPGLAAAAIELAALITRASGGRIVVNVYGAGELVAPFEVFDAVGRGTAEMGHSAAYFWKGRSEAAPYFCAVPFGMSAQEMNAWLQFGGGLELWRELYAPFNVVPFAAGNTGMQMAGWSNREIRSLADLAGMKMRIPGLGGEVMARVGVTTVNIPGDELAAALKSGALDAAEWLGPYNDLAFGLHAVTKFCYYPGWQEPGPTLECLVNKAAFDALPDDLKAIVESSCRAVNDSTQAAYTARNAQALQQLVVEHKVRLRALPRDVIAALRRASDDVLEAAAAKDPFTRRVRDSARAFQARASAWHAVSEQAWYATRG